MNVCEIRGGKREVHLFYPAGGLRNTAVPTFDNLLREHENGGVAVDHVFPFCDLPYGYGCECVWLHLWTL